MTFHLSLNSEHESENDDKLSRRECLSFSNTKKASLLTCPVYVEGEIIQKPLEIEINSLLP